MIPEATEQLRYEYPLEFDSLVMDVGAYKGEFAREIANRYRCFVMAFEPVFYREIKPDSAIGAYPHGVIQVHPYALGDSFSLSKFAIRNDSTSMYREGEEYAYCPVVPISIVFARYNIARVHLLKLNCEGSEYEILWDLINGGLIGSVDDIQIQFHNFDESMSALGARDRLQTALAATHHPTYCTPWVWENWRRNDA